MTDYLRTLQAYYTLFDYDNFRLGFACNGPCEGGTWHGRGVLMEIQVFLFFAEEYECAAYRWKL